MAYFPNGTAGEVLDDQCDSCLHGMNDGVLCPVYHAQMEFNYKQVDDGQELLRAAMTMLINEQGKCQMKTAIEQAGIKLDLSGRDQLPLLEG
jgi:hypothetical protein